MKQLRERAGLRTAEVAAKLGCGESTVRSWDIGKSVPHLALDQIPVFLDLYQTDLKEAIAAMQESRSKFEKGLIPPGKRGPKRGASKTK